VQNNRLIRDIAQKTGKKRLYPDKVKKVSPFLDVKIELKNRLVRAVADHEVGSPRECKDSSRVRGKNL